MHCGFPEPADDVFIQRSGPGGMNKTVDTICKEKGYT